jgi:hypothetical protein
MAPSVAQTDPVEGSREVLESARRGPAANHELTKAPIAKTGMLIRKPVAEVFEIIVNPAVTSKYWFS